AVARASSRVLLPRVGARRGGGAVRRQLCPWPAAALAADGGSPPLLAAPVTRRCGRRIDCRVPTSAALGRLVAPGRRCGRGRTRIVARIDLSARRGRSRLGTVDDRAGCLVVRRQRPSAPGGMGWAWPPAVRGALALRDAGPGDYLRWGRAD